MPFPRFAISSRVFCLTIFAGCLPAAIAVAAPPEVIVVKPIESEVTYHEDFVARTEASQTVDIRPRTSGVLEKAMFEEGAAVKKGDVLFQLDGRMQKAEMEKARAEIAQAEAKLKQVELEHQRLVKLLQAKAVTREEVEAAAAALEAAKAGIVAAKAGLEVAALNLESTRIVAPISGHIGRRNVDVGNIVKSDGDPPLATVVVTDPLYVCFNVNERSYLRLSRLLRERKETKLNVAVTLNADEKSKHTAVVNLVDNRVDRGTVRVRAVLANPNGELLPGLAGTVRVEMAPAQKALLVPQAAVRHADGVASVLTVNDKNILEERKVKVLRAVGDSVAIVESLKADDKVVNDPKGRKAGDEVKPRIEKERPPEKAGPGTAAPRPLPELPGTGPALVVTAKYPGANAQEIEATIAAPISEELKGLEGVLKQFVTCTQGEMSLTLVMKKGADLNAAVLLARERIAIAQPKLPAGVVREGITIKKRPVHLLNVALLSPDGSRDRDFIGNYAEKQLRNEFFRVSGVADLNFYGDVSPAPQLQMRIDREKLRAFGLTQSDVLLAVQSDSVLRPGVTIADQQTPEEMGNITIRVREGLVVRLKDVATFEMVSATGTLTSLDGKPCVVLMVSRTTDADANETAKAVQAAVDKLAKSLPAGLELRVIDDGR
jgi:RND family efflux transporter MFP subunit